MIALPGPNGTPAFPASGSRRWESFPSQMPLAMPRHIMMNASCLIQMTFQRFSAEKCVLN